MKPGDLVILQWPDGICQHNELVGPPNNKRLAEGGVQCYVRVDNLRRASHGWLARSSNRFLAGTPVVCTSAIWSGTYIQFMVAGRLLWAQKKYLELLA